MHHKATSNKFHPHGADLARLEAERCEFAMTLSQHLVEGKQVCYFDETSMSHRQVQKRAWYFRREKFQIPIAASKGKAFTIYGTIGDCIQNNGYFEIHGSTNKKDFMAYLLNLQTRMIPPQNELPIFVYDNHRAHIGMDRLEILNQFCRPMRSIAYSCFLNQPIEAYWSVCKARALPLFT